MQQPILGLYTAPRPLRLMVCACLDRPWSLLPAEPRVRPLVGHFQLASQSTEREAATGAVSLSHHPDELLFNNSATRAWVRSGMGVAGQSPQTGLVAPPPYPARTPGEGCGAPPPASFRVSRYRLRR